MKIIHCLAILLALAAASAAASPRLELSAGIGGSDGFGIEGLESAARLAVEHRGGPWIFRAEGSVYDADKVETGDGTRLQARIRLLRGFQRQAGVYPWIGLGIAAGRQETSLWTKDAVAPEIGGGVVWPSGRAGLWYQAPDSSPNKLSAWGVTLRQRLGRGLVFGAEVNLAGDAVAYRLFWGWSFGLKRWPS